MKEFCEKVKEKVSSDEYLALLRYLHDYSNGGMTAVGLQEMVSALFRKYPGFLDEFLYIFDVSDGLTRPTESAESGNKRKIRPGSDKGVGVINGYSYNMKIRLSFNSSLLQSPDPEFTSTARNKTKDRGFHQALRFCEKVRKKTSPEEYLALLHCLHDYSTGKITKVGMKMTVNDKLPDFVDDFLDTLEFFESLSPSSSESEEILIGNKGKKPNKNMKSTIPRLDQLTPSYRFLPEYLSGAQSSVVDDELKVLNTCCYSKGSFRGCKLRPKDPYEEMLNEREDELFERDMLMGWMRSTKENATKLNKAILEGEIKMPNVDYVKSHFTSYNFRVIERMYGENGLQVVEQLLASTELLLPIILTRLDLVYSRLSKDI